MASQKFLWKSSHWQSFRVGISGCTRASTALQKMSRYLTYGMYLLAAIKCCHRKLLVTGIMIWSCASLSIYFSTSTSVSSFGVVANANQVLFRRVQGWIGTEWALRICSKPLPMVVISCVMVHDVSSHLRLLCVKYKLRKEQNQNWPPLSDFCHRGGSTHMSTAIC